MIAKGFVTEFLNAALSSTITVAAILFFARIFFKGYIDQKSKNLATKEDVGEITDIVEKIKHENAQVLEKIKAEHAEKLEDIRKENQLLISSIDKQLDLKIKIYTDAMAAFTGIIHTIENFVAPDYPPKEFHLTVVEHSKAISKVLVVGSNKICISVLDFMASFNEEAILVIEKRLQLDKLQGEIYRLKNIDKKGEDELISNLEKEIVSKEDDHKTKLYNLSELCTDTKSKLEELHFRFVLDTREELGFEINEDEFFKAQNDYFARLKKVSKHHSESQMKKSI